MTGILKRILLLLEMYFEERRNEQLELKIKSTREVWLDTTTVKFMLRVGDRMLYNYVRNGKLIIKKRGLANFYLESSVLDLMNR